VKHVGKTLKQNQKKAERHNQIQRGCGNSQRGGIPGKQERVSYNHDTGDKKYKHCDNGNNIPPYQNYFCDFRTFYMQHIDADVRPFPGYHVEGEKNNPYIHIGTQFFGPENAVKKQITSGNLGQIYHQQNNREQADDNL
jgi:hypothetical protein